MLNALIFDVDGTLVKYVFDARRTKLELIEFLESRGFVTGDLTAGSKTHEIFQAARRQIESGQVKAVFEDVRSGMFRILDESELRTCQLAKALPGVSDSLQFLKGKSVKMAVLTNGGRRPAIEVLKREGLLDYFQFILCRDDVGEMKPSPSGLRKAAEMLDSPGTKVHYVGDSVMDIVAARAAGIKVISVATGEVTQDRLRAEGADYVIGSIADLAKTLGIE